MLAFEKWDRGYVDSAYYAIGVANTYYGSLHEYWIPITVPIYVALGCTVYMAFLLATRLAGWCFKSVSRRFRRSPGGST